MRVNALVRCRAEANAERGVAATVREAMWRPLRPLIARRVGLVVSMSWTRANVRETIGDLRKIIDALDEALVATRRANEAGERGDDDDDDGLELTSDYATTLAADCALGLRDALERVKVFAGEAYRDVEDVRSSVASGRGHRGKSRRDDEDVEDDENGYEDAFGADGKPKKYVPKKGHTLPGMQDAIGELRGVLKKVGVSSRTPPGGVGTEDAVSSGAEADGESSEVETAPVVEKPKAGKPQWMVELAAKNAAKRAATLDGGA